MITEFKEFGAVVVAIDDKKGLKEFAAQNNIDEIIESENLIEELKNSISELKDEKMYLEKYSNSFVHMLTDKKYSVKSRLPLFVGIFISLFIVTNFISNPIVGAGLLAATLGIEIASLTNAYSTYKKEMSLKLNSVTAELDKFESELIDEKKLLNELKKDKTNTSTKRDKVIVNNSDNKKIIEVRTMRKLFNDYRDNCLKLDSYYKKIDKTFDSAYSQEEVDYIKEIHISNHKNLSKRK